MRENSPRQDRPARNEKQSAACPPTGRKQLSEIEYFGFRESSAMIKLYCLTKGQLTLVGLRDSTGRD